MKTFDERTWNRRAFLLGTAQAAAATAAGSLLATNAVAEETVQGGTVADPMIAGFAQHYLKAMNAPGMTLGMVHADGRATASTFGRSDVERKLPVQPEMLFQVGSISKSFCAFVVLQMSDEGKLDLRRSVLDYLPWLPIETTLGEVNVHHLLTHSSGLPDNSPLFLSDRNACHKQGFKPGSQFHYSNLGYEILGHLASALDGVSYARVLRIRILDPLGMTVTRAVLSYETRAAEAHSYALYRDDLNNVRGARLEEAPREVSDSAARCVVSTASDMTHYLKMILATGVGPSGRIVSEKSFELLATPHVRAEVLGKSACYGYGVVVDRLDGHKLLTHTGGMQSFASSMMVDTEGGVAAFASVNTNQGYRPDPVTRYALRLMRAQTEKRPAPVVENLDVSEILENAQDYAGTYTGAAGTAKVVAAGKSLSVWVEGKQIRLQRADGDRFVAADEAWQEYLWIFTRDTSTKQGEKAHVTELMFGSSWYTNDAYRGPKKDVTVPTRLLGFPGVYDSGNDCLRVVICKGVLVAADIPLEEIRDGLFRFCDEAHSPETVEFLYPVDGRTRMALVSGVPHWRIEID
jgi:CubicO group peptidase (beta-lactamase class C family)